MEARTPNTAVREEGGIRRWPTVNNGVCRHRWNARHRVRDRRFAQAAPTSPRAPLRRRVNAAAYRKLTTIRYSPNPMLIVANGPWKLRPVAWRVSMPVSIAPKKKSPR